MPTKSVTADTSTGLVKLPLSLRGRLFRRYATTSWWAVLTSVPDRLPISFTARRSSPVSGLRFSSRATRRLVKGVTFELLPVLLGREYRRGYCGSASCTNRPALISVTRCDGKRAPTVTLYRPSAPVVPVWL